MSDSPRFVAPARASVDLTGANMSNVLSMVQESFQRRGAQVTRGETASGVAFDIDRDRNSPMTGTTVGVLIPGPVNDVRLWVERQGGSQAQVERILNEVMREVSTPDQRGEVRVSGPPRSGRTTVGVAGSDEVREIPNADPIVYSMALRDAVNRELMAQPLGTVVVETHQNVFGEVSRHRWVRVDRETVFSDRGDDAWSRHAVTADSQYPRVGKGERTPQTPEQYLAEQAGQMRAKVFAGLRDSRRPMAAPAPPETYLG
jgi:hypothetical protein